MGKARKRFEPNGEAKEEHRCDAKRIEPLWSGNEMSGYDTPSQGKAKERNEPTCCEERRQGKALKRTAKERHGNDQIRLAGPRCGDVQKRGAMNSEGMEMKDNAYALRRKSYESQWK